MPRASVTRFAGPAAAARTGCRAQAGEQADGQHEQQPGQPADAVQPERAGQRGEHGQLAGAGTDQLPLERAGYAADA